MKEKPAQEVKTARRGRTCESRAQQSMREMSTVQKDLQEKISKGIRDIFSGNKKKETEEDS